MKEDGFSKLFFLMSLEMLRDVLELLCFTMEVYCLLKLLAILKEDVRYLPLNLIAWLVLLLPFFPLRFLINLNSLEEQLLVISFTFSLHLHFRCSFIS